MRWRERQGGGEKTGWMLGEGQGWAEAKEVGQILGTDGMEKLEEMNKICSLGTRRLNSSTGH